KRRVDITFDEGVAVEVAAVDERLDAGENQVTAKGIVVKYGALEVACCDGGDCRLRGDSARLAHSAVPQRRGADRKQRSAGNRDAARARRLGKLGHGAIERRQRAESEVLGDLQPERRSHYQRR